MRNTAWMRRVLTAFIFSIMTIGPAAFAQDQEPAALSAAEVPVTDETAVKADPAPAMDEALMAKFKEYSTPNENHKVLEAFAGNWTAVVKQWMAPNGDPTVSEGKSVNALIFDGRFLEQKFSGTFMETPFEGTGLFGYDNIKKEYESLWFDNMATGIMRGKLQYDPATKTFSEESHFSCPLTNSERTSRGKITLVDAGHYTQEFFMADLATGEEFKSMEISYSRVK